MIPKDQRVSRAQHVAVLGDGDCRNKGPADDCLHAHAERFA